MSARLFDTSPLTAPLPASLPLDPAYLFDEVADIYPGALIGHTPAQDPALTGEPQEVTP